MATATTDRNWLIADPPPFPLRRFTVEEYHLMADAGVFVDDEQFELLEGWIVPKMTRKPPHDVAIVLAQTVLQSLLPQDWHLRIQSAITTADSEPEPDLALVRGTARDYVDHHPGPADIALVVEVADTSLEHDRDTKGRIYARAGIPVYWIVNLIDRTIEVYTDPTGPNPSPCYRRREDFGPDQSVPLALDGQPIGPVAVRDVLP